MEETKDSKAPDAAPRYFNISPLALAALSFLTFGLYELYWFYKQWWAVKQVNPQVKHPAWRAIFSIFYCYSLFKLTLNSAKHHGYAKTYSPGLLAAAYIILALVGNSWGRASELAPAVDIGLWLVFSLSFVPLMYAQQAASFTNKKRNIPLEKKTTPAEVTLIVIGLLVTFLFLLGTLFAGYVSPEKQAQIDSAKSQVKVLSGQYESCATALSQERDSLDLTSQAAVDAYNTKLADCENVRQQQNDAVLKYNRLIK